MNRILLKTSVKSTISIGSQWGRLRSGLKLLAFTLALYMTAGHAETPNVIVNSDTLAASVNGAPIRLDQLAPKVQDELRRYKKYGVRSQDEELMKALQMQALEKLISVELIYQEARKLSIDDIAERVSEKVNEIQLQNGEHEGFDKAKIKETITKNILIDEYLTRNKLKNTEPPESEIKVYYDKNKEAFAREESVRTRHILVSVAADATAKEKEDAMKKIENARKQLLDGKPFEKVAKSYSDCNSASGGGELGYQQRGYMPQAFDDIAFSSEIGKLSGIIETEFGYHILEVLDHKYAGIQSFDEVKEFIGRYLKIENTKKALERHIGALKSKAKIDIYL